MHDVTLGYINGHCDIKENKIVKKIQLDYHSRDNKTDLEILIKICQNAYGKHEWHLFTLKLYPALKNIF